MIDPVRWPDPGAVHRRTWLRCALSKTKLLPYHYLTQSTLCFALLADTLQSAGRAAVSRC